MAERFNGVTSTTRLLLVEDDPDNLDVFTVILRAHYRIIGFRDAAAALAALDAATPDLVVLDIRMSPVDGVQCLQAIRARPGYGRIPAIALTAVAREGDREAFLAAGFQMVVTKPVLDDRTLLTAIASVLNNGRGAASGRSAG
jgi:two-component system, chemotaxis family, CheB/CheR fusion protein